MSEPNFTKCGAVDPHRRTGSKTLQIRMTLHDWKFLGDRAAENDENRAAYGRRRLREIGALPSEGRRPEMHSRRRPTPSPQSGLIEEMVAMVRHLAPSVPRLYALRRMAAALPHHECDRDGDEPEYENVVRWLKELATEISVEVGSFPTRRSRTNPELPHEG